MSRLLRRRPLFALVALTLAATPIASGLTQSADPPAAPPAATKDAPSAAPSAGAARPAPAATGYQWFDPIIETRLLLANAFIDESDDTAMQEAVLSAMVSSLGDPYTVYVPPQGERDFNKALRGTYVGIGAEIDLHENYLRIVTPLDDSPAQRSGVMAGDLVLSINGESTLGKSADDCM